MSKYKDYFDYFQGIYGIDHNKIYVRGKVVKKKELNLEGDDIHELNFAIGGTLYTMYAYKKKLYHTVEELDKLDKLYKADRFKVLGRRVYRGKGEDNKNQYKKENGVEIDANMIHRKPVLMKIGRKGEWQVPLLCTFNFHNILSAKEVYINVETFMGWIVDNPPLPDTQTNEGKIVGHGFDLKESFRHRK